MSTDAPISNISNNDSPPPFFESWRALYAIVLAELGVLIILFYLFMKAFE